MFSQLKTAYSKESIIVVKGVLNSMTPKFLSTAYTLFGPVEDVFIPRNEPKYEYTAFVVFKNENTAKVVLETARNMDLLGAQITNSPFSYEEYPSDLFSVSLKLSEKAADHFVDSYTRYPQFFTTYYSQRVDRAELPDDRPCDFSNPEDFIDIKKTKLFYNFGFRGKCIQADDIPESELPKI